MRERHPLRTPFIVAVSVAVAALAGVACDGAGTASCNEGCDESEDCQAGLACYPLASGGKRCAPDGCDACFDQGKSCYWDENTAEQEQGEDLECSFRECG